MSRHISRSLFRSPTALSQIYRAPQTRRFLSTAPPAQKSRSWKSSAVRWGIAAGAIYFYNTSPIFADNPTLLEPLFPDSQTDDTSLPTLESIAKSRPTRSAPQEQLQSTAPLSPSTITMTGSDSPTPSPLSDPSATESEASQQGAFNEETGEINWDCPCLGGMATGPCGEQFKQAFSCFVYSKEDPKGMDCIEHFKTMQGCFREYPDIYGGELDEEDVDEGLREQMEADGAGAGDGPGDVVTAAPAPAMSAAATASEDQQGGSGGARNTEDPSQSEALKTDRAKEAKAQIERDHAAPLSETDNLVPKAAHDARAAN
ncbi:MAG: hypothetical protein Q9219_006151 [cf. Caloplaca sp. 3 TL-2023]